MLRAKALIGFNMLIYIYIYCFYQISTVFNDSQVVKFANRWLNLQALMKSIWLPQRKMLLFWA